MFFEFLVLGKIFRNSLFNNIEWYVDEVLEYIGYLGVNRELWRKV